MKRVLIAMTVLLTCWAYAWGEANGPSGRFGIGIREPGRISQWEYYLKFFITQQLEISSGVEYESDNQFGGDHKELRIGLGTFRHLNHHSPVHIKLGVRAGYGYDKRSGSFSHSKRSSWNGGPAAGVEYFFSSHLSIGPEISYQFGRTFDEYVDEFYNSTTKSDFSTQEFATAIAIVFYF